MEIKKARKKDAREISILRRKTLSEINKNDYPQEHLHFLINDYWGRSINRANSDHQEQESVGFGG